MRFLFVVAVALIVAFAATPSAHAGSLARSMPRTPRGPEGMARCTEEPMSLAFDVVEREAARFLAPDSLTSRNDGVAPALRTPARSEEHPAQQAVNVRLGAAPAAPSGARKAQSAPCGRSSTHMISCAALGETEGRAPASAPSTDELLIVTLAIAFPSIDEQSQTALSPEPPVTNVHGFARDAHTRGPWRPPRA
jgi:hypothetical protein